MGKLDNDRDEPPEWWEVEYPWVEDDRYWYNGAEFERVTCETGSTKES